MGRYTELQIDTAEHLADQIFSDFIEALKSTPSFMQWAEGATDDELIECAKYLRVNAAIAGGIAASLTT